ncbi:glucosaminidase domain-containing protein [Ichthyenterobacterium sp. W332]|uniref:Peptidoglycan hydrolase n=1 Tax=Microcosmobacter mediterraneus TaxID=3075607 RepID=A0ABU2YP98_9FLAO|nr:glucosaminidase domain-containing protein [Ichthyenterobacterium sp. W332]MDT0559075.1 glucosaminidase domain-containing protein [Ichthyenterobacterium sp. W332]
MNKIKSDFLYIILVLLVFSCGPKKGIIIKKDKSKDKQVSATEKESETPNEIKKSESSTKPITSVDAYIDRFSGIAKDEMRKNKIPASITLAQGILESGSGKGRLSLEANNHFGIKCHGWTGKKIYHDDDRRQECFRKYDNPNSSYEDHSKFLTTRGRYSKLFKLKPDDYRAWAKGLRSAGYATDRKYPQKLISLIERYELYKYDQEVLESSGLRKNSSNAITHKVIKGDTLYSLSKKYGVSIESIQKLNNIEGNAISLGQVLQIKN